MRQTTTASIALADNGLIVVRIRDGVRQSPDDARANLDAAIAEAGGTRRPILVDITRALPLEAETRHLYSGQQLLQAFSALALLVEASPLGRMMGNVYFRVARPGIPLHLFSDEARAVEWLTEFVDRH
jgi:hypothetical protein